MDKRPRPRTHTDAQAYAEDEYELESDDEDDMPWPLDAVAPSVKDAPANYEVRFYRVKRALHHLMHKDHPLVPVLCDGCKEIAGFLTVPGYAGDADYPPGIDWDRNL